jgi:acyl carrier protein
MPSRKKRLIYCFASVFPELDENEIIRSSVTSLSNWDSVAMVTLISVIEEEFEIEIDSDGLEQFLSFELVNDFLKDVIDVH